MEKTIFEVNGIIGSSNYQFPLGDNTKKEQLQDFIEFLELSVENKKYVISSLIMNNDFYSGDIVELNLEIKYFDAELNVLSVEGCKTLIGKLQINCDTFSEIPLESFIVDDFNVLVYLNSYQNCQLTLSMKLLD